MVNILFLTWCEYGQASVHLATAFELYGRQLPGVAIHVASSGHLEKRFNQVKACIDEGSTEYGSISFHNVLAKSFSDMQPGSDDGNWTTMSHPPIQTNSCPEVGRAMCPYSPDEYVRGIDSCAELIRSLSPDAVLVDMLFFQAIDACKLLGQPFIMLSPLPGSNMAHGNQPWYRTLFCNPATGSDAPFPFRTWKDMLINAHAFVRLTYTLLTSPHLKTVDAARRTRGCTWPHPVTTAAIVSPGTPCICPGIPAIDLPFSAPAGLYQVGPICVPSAPLVAGDPELATWLDRGETVLMVMGSHIAYDEARARDVLRGLLAGVGDRQVLWKVPSVDKLRAVFDEMLPTERDRDRVRVVRWLEAEPAVIVEHPNVVCYVHHGGANSYLESARSGTPQVILPTWYDTYQNATRLEYRGLGVYGSKTAAPGVASVELGHAVWRVVAGPQSGEFRRRAQEVAPKCREAGGRERAADLILEYLARPLNDSRTSTVGYI